MGFDESNFLDLPEWAGGLKFDYWCIRVYGRNKTKRRFHYRRVEREKLRLAELGIDQRKIIAVCRYLSCLKGTTKIRTVLEFDDLQMILDFT